MKLNKENKNRYIDQVKRIIYETKLINLSWSMSLFAFGIILIWPFIDNYIFHRNSHPSIKPFMFCCSSGVFSLLFFIQVLRKEMIGSMGKVIRGRWSVISSGIAFLGFLLGAFASLYYAIIAIIGK